MEHLPSRVYYFYSLHRLSPKFLVKQYFFCSDFLSFRSLESLESKLCRLTYLICFFKDIWIILNELSIIFPSLPVFKQYMLFGYKSRVEGELATLLNSLSGGIVFLNISQSYFETTLSQELAFIFYFNSPLNSP